VGKLGFLRPPECTWQKKLPEKDKKPKKSKRKPKTVIATYDEQCKILWRTMVKDRAGWKCEYCGIGIDEGKKLDAHHIYTKKNTNTRWDLDNGMCLCVSHHTFSEIFSAHLTPAEFHEWLLEYKGQTFMNTLRNKKNTMRDRDLSYYIETLGILEEENEKMSTQK
jgi:hypothetical protein